MTKNMARRNSPFACSYKQQGISVFAAMVVLVVAVFFGMMGFKLVPAYMEYLTIRQVARDAADNAELMRQPQSVVLKHIDDAYRMNNLWSTKAKETIVLAKDKSNGYSVRVDYEKRVNLLLNIDLVTVFAEDINTY